MGSGLSSLYERVKAMGSMTPSVDMNLNLPGSANGAGGEQVNLRDLYDIISVGRLSELAIYQDVAEWISEDDYTPGMSPLEAVDVRISKYIATPTWTNWPTFGILSHQFAANIFPRETNEGMTGSLNFADASDFDVVYTADGVGVVSHDNTLSTDTTDTRLIDEICSLGLRFIDVDAGNWFTAEWGDLKLLLLADALTALGHKRRMSIETKVQGQASLLASDIIAAALEDSVLASTAYWSDVDDLVNAGLNHVGFVMTTGTEKTPAELTAAGVNWVHILYTASAFNSSWVASMHAVGIKVIAYTVNRHVDIQTVQATNCDGIFSDDPLYAYGVLGDYRYRRNTDSFANKTFGHGQIAGGANVRGVYGATDSWGFADATNLGARTVLAGEFCPLPNDNGDVYDPLTDTITINFTLDIDSQSDSGRWMGIYVGFDNDKAMNDGSPAYSVNNGYRCLISQTGSLQVQKYTAGVVDGAASSQATAAITPPITNVQCRVTITPTQVKMERLNGTTGTATKTDSSYRGAYFHYGESGTTGRFRSVSTSVV